MEDQVTNDAVVPETEPAPQGLIESIEKDAEAVIDAGAAELKHVEQELKESLSPTQYQKEVKVEKELPPQLKIETFPSQLFWLAVVFVVFYVLMSRRAIPRIRDVLEKRQTQITHDIDTAERAKADAEKARQNYEKELASARTKAAELIAEAQAAVNASVSAEQHTLDQKLAKSLQEAEARIDDQVAELRKTMLPAVVDVTRSIVEKILNTTADDKALNAAVSAEMKG